METIKLPEIIPVEPKIMSNPQDIAWNMDDVKSYLTAITDKYKGLVVTDDNEKDMSKVKNEIVSLRTNLTRFKKKGKDLLNNPVRTFESECDELLIIIDDVERPLKDQLQKYEDDRIAALNTSIEKEIEMKSQAAGLDASYLFDFQRDKRWYNKTYKYSQTLIDIDKEISRLSESQRVDTERRKMLAEREELIKTTVEFANKGLQSPLNAQLYMSMDADQYTFGDIKKRIMEDADQRKAIEQAAKEAEIKRQEEIKRKELERLDEVQANIARKEEQNLIEEQRLQKEEIPIPPVSQEEIDKMAELDKVPELIDVTITFHGIPADKVEELYQELDIYGYEYDVR
jgi:hypothetical protein